MKIYLFNPDTGAYLGEDFADEAPMRRGEFVIPPDATSVAPQEVGQGEFPVFDPAARRWERRPKPGVRSGEQLTPPDRYRNRT